MSSETRSSNCRTRATTRTTTCSSGSARWTPRGDPATSATDIAAAHRLRAPSPSSWMRSRTGSAPDRASGCWSPAARIRGSPATSAPANRWSAAVGWRPATHTVHVGDGASRLRLPAGRAAVNRLNHARAQRSPAARRRRVPASPHIGLTGSGTQLVQPGVFRHAAHPFRLGQRTDLHHQHGEPVLRPEVQPVGAHRLGGPDVQRRNLLEPLGPVDLNGGNDFRASPQHDLVSVLSRAAAPAGRDARAAPAARGCGRRSERTGSATSRG